MKMGLDMHCLFRGKNSDKISPTMAKRNSKTAHKLFRVEIAMHVESLMDLVSVLRLVELRSLMLKSIAAHTHF
jgi:hypothetical protein